MPSPRRGSIVVTDEVTGFAAADIVMDEIGRQEGTNRQRGRLRQALARFGQNRLDRRHPRTLA
jgi:hypothetical protein